MRFGKVSWEKEGGHGRENRARRVERRLRVQTRRSAHEELLYVRNVGLMDSCKLILCVTGSHPRCFFHRGGVRALSSDEFQEVLRSCFIYRNTKTGGLHSVAFGF